MRDRLDVGLRVAPVLGARDRPQRLAGQDDVLARRMRARRRARKDEQGECEEQTIVASAEARRRR